MPHLRYTLLCQTRFLALNGPRPGGTGRSGADLPRGKFSSLPRLRLAKPPRGQLKLCYYVDWQRISPIRGAGACEWCAGTLSRGRRSIAATSAAAAREEELGGQRNPVIRTGVRGTAPRTEIISRK